MDYRISHPYEIVNQWDICDWIFRYDNDEEWAEKVKRK
jgi:hypothetical protein